MSEQERPAPEEARPDTERESMDWRERFKRVIEKPQPRWSVFILALATVFAKGYRPEHVEVPQKSESATTLKLRGLEVNFQSWESFDAQETEPIAIENGAIRIMIEQSNSYDQTPATVEDPVKFSQWVEQEIMNPVVQQAAQVTSIEKATPKQWVAIAGAIVAKNLEFDPTTVEQLIFHADKDSPAPGSHLFKTSDELPVDRLLAEHKPAVCRHFAAATVEVFEGIKKQRGGLENIYVRQASSLDLQHAWNTVFKVTGPNTANIAFIDPTAADNDWTRIAGRQDYAEFLHSLNLQGILDTDTTIALTSEYSSSGNTSALREWHLIERITPTNLLQVGHKVKMLEHLLARPEAELIAAEQQPKGHRIRTHAASLLAKLRADPKAQILPEW